jgi:hypothetical protein
MGRIQGFHGNAMGYDARVTVIYESRKMCATIFVVLTAIITASLMHAQSATLDQATGRAVIERVLKEIAAGYIFSEKAPDIAQEIHKREGSGAYDTASGEEFARRLTKDLQSAAHDLHFEIDYFSEVLPQEPTASAGPTREERFDAGKDDNYGFRKIEILKGNVGFIAFDTFHRAEAIGQALAAAMDFVSNTDALILDLRNNDGGRADAVALLVSYSSKGIPNSLSEFTGNRCRRRWNLSPHRRLRVRNIWTAIYTFPPARTPSLPPRVSAIT